MAAPTLTTNSASSVGAKSATLNATINTGSAITARGFQFNTVQTAPPSGKQTITEEGYFSTGAFTATLSGLTPGKKYYVRAFATNADGTGYGGWAEFTATASQHSITINAVERKGDIKAKSLTITDVINDVVNTCKFILEDISGNGIPNNDQEIIVKDVDGNVIFSGYVVNVSYINRVKAGGIAAVNVSCIDYGRLLDRNLVHRTYTSQTDAAIIQDIITRYCAGAGITVNNVIEGVTIDQIAFNYIQPSQAIRRICELTGRSWYIDYDKDIHYFPTTTNAAPFNIGDHTERTNYIDDNMIGDYVGTLKNNATHDSADGFVTLTPASGSKNGQIEYTSALASIFTAEFDVWAGGGSGADAIYFYWGCSSTPTGEDSAAGGYVVAIDEYDDEIQLQFNGTPLTSVAYSSLDNSIWRRVKIVVNGTNIKVYVGNVLQIDYDDTSRTLPGNRVGLGARTGGSTNEHRVKILHVYTPANSATDYQGLSISKDASQIKNRVYVRGGTKLSDFTTYIEVGDGEKTQFVLPDKPHDVTLEVDRGSGYVEESVGIKNVDTTGYKWYLNFQEKYVEQDDGETVLSATDKIRLTYKYDIPILVAVENTSSILENGQREFAIFDKSITTTQAARDRASGELTDYANDIIEGSFVTWTQGFVSGQYMNISKTEYDVDDDYIIQKVVARSIGAGEYQYEVYIASAKTLGIIKFLIELLEANKNLIELDDDEVVDELLQLSDSLLDDSLLDSLVIDSTGPYHVYQQDSAPYIEDLGIARWGLSQWKY